MSLLTVEGLYNYDNTLFDGFNVPEGIVKQIAIDTILMRTRELEILYPNFTYMKNRITIWSNKYQINWKKLYDTTVLEYNPIENYDRVEDWTDTDDETTTSARDNTRNTNNTVKSTSTNEIVNNVNVTDQNTAFNAGLADHAKQITDGDTTENGTITNTETGKDTENESVNGGRTGKHTRNGRAHGNIGVTTSQQMIQSERDLVVFNLYDVIAESFIENFCLMVY
nr:MAG TPA: Portal protein, Proximal tail tube, phi29, mature virion, VIRUS.3A [Caudoviricetes sp.]